MEENFIKWTDKDIKFRTDSNKLKYQYTKDQIQAYELDIEKENRKKSMECRYCYYIKNICGFSAMVISYCGICKEPILNNSSDINKVCDKCAGSKGLCIRCGGDID